MAKKNNVCWYNYPKFIGGLIASGFVVVTSSVFVIKGIDDIVTTRNNQEYYETATLINNQVFEEAYGNYDKYIELIAKAIKESDMNNSSMEVFVAYTNMEKNGWISLGDKFEYGDPDFEPIGNMGISVVLGEGVCRNQAFNLFKVFDSLGYESGVLYGNIYSSLPSDENPHAVTYVRDGKKVFLYDPTNKTVFLRDVWGHFISIDDENIKFNPSMYIDNQFNCLKDNMPVHMYFGEDYGSYITYDTRRTRAQQKVDELGDYYKEYEEAYLEYYEKQIALEKDRYDEIIDQILSVRDEEVVEVKIY
ncbi:MAG: hypothetical protein K2I70_05595 [Bacilli bacterium]|nr:hypothetical protein [Bacilli bacterium]